MMNTVAQGVLGRNQAVGELGPQIRKDLGRGRESTE